MNDPLKVSSSKTPCQYVHPDGICGLTIDHAHNFITTQEGEIWGVLDKVLEDCSENVQEAVKTIIRQQLEDARTEEASNCADHELQARKDERETYTSHLRSQIEGQRPGFKFPTTNDREYRLQCDAYLMAKDDILALLPKNKD